MKKNKFLLLFYCFVIFFPIIVKAQYFGRNKAKYDIFKFKVYQTPHFELYNYLNNDSVLNTFAQNSEKWYNFHQEALKDTLDERNAIILYGNHADFQQTTVISGEIGVGTGGVTEGLKNRIVMPVMETHAQTDHVLGHELVHAFQYNIIKTGDSTNLNSIRNLPLWMVEGLAEYMSIGKIDPHTSLWMRDAILNNDFPTLREMSVNPKYFPYRYGQAFWAFVTGIWGDTIIAPLFNETAKYGYEMAIKLKLRVDVKTFDNMWKTATKEHYTPLIKDSLKNIVGKKLIYDKNAGEMNISPSISPDGKNLMFLSEKNVISLDMYVAEAKSGKIIRRIKGEPRDGHIDALSFLESSGTWSPDSRQYAYVAFSEGRNKLVIANVRSGRVVRVAEIPGVESFSNPSWSPDGNAIVVAGQVNGQSDLWLYDLKKRKSYRLTNDIYSDIQPTWSFDGSKILFSSDRLGLSNRQSLKKYAIGISILDLKTNIISNVPVFAGADNLNPQFSYDGNEIFFLSDRDGYRNLYNHNLTTGKTYQLTRYSTGITGITEFSPAISISSEGQIVYSLYYKNRYSIYRAQREEFTFEQVSSDSLDYKAATLPPYRPVPFNIVNKNISRSSLFPVMAVDSFKYIGYRPKFQLDYIGNTSVGVATSSFGTGIAGGVSMLFSDILGNHTIFSGLAINGEIYDFGGQVAYLNQERRVNWGVSVSHIPYRYGFLSYGLDSLERSLPNGTDTTISVAASQLNIFRTFEEQVGIFSYFPISTVRRLEAGASWSYYSYRIDRYSDLYNEFGYIGSKKEKVPGPSAYSLYNGNLAYVFDNSAFGIASPLTGQRYRIGTEKYLGELDFHTFLVDYRRYIWLKPFSFAFRGVHYARYGKDAENERLYPFFVGFPTLVRGYQADFLYDVDRLTVNQLIGSRMAVTNFEVRMPFTGPRRLSLIKSGYLFTELAAFVDGGLAWDSENKPFLREESGAYVDRDNTGDERIKRVPVFSTGVSLRINVFGMLILEPYYAFPLFQDIHRGVFGLNFAPGW